MPKWISQIKNEKKRKRWKGWYKRPWTVPTSRLRARGFKKALWSRGYLSPNFTRAEAASKDGRPIPRILRGGAQRSAFKLEKARHDLGDKAMGPISWYRSPQHNAAVGGAILSKHMLATAHDWDRSERDRLGGPKFDAAMRRYFPGIGLNPGGVVRHADTGPRRTWYY